MKVIYSFHAISRIKERGIKRNKIEDCLKNPDKIISNEDKKAVKKMNSKAMIVVYKSLNSKNFIITVFETSKVYKYL